MALIEINWKPSRRDLYVFAIAQLIAATLVAWALHRRWDFDAAAVGLLAVSALVMVVGFAAPHALRPLFVAWMVAAFPVGWLMSHVLIGIVYYGVVTPIGLILRLRGRDSLQLRSKTEAPSFWIVRQGARDAASYFRQF
jgi:cellobiose-specific phosphotransferase system component IIC